jgi:hypothetical protein
MRPGGALWEGWTSGEEMLSMLDVMSSTRLLTNLGATFAQRESIQVCLCLNRKRAAYCWYTTIKVVEVLIQGIAI